MERENHYYTDERNAQIVIALLKAHGIRKIVANPGTTNIAFVGSVQNDDWFEVYSGVDERHSAYLAVGLAAESGEPVVLSCTGATASRNYLPALTEAYYRKVPILALTSMQNFDNVGQLAPQALDRSEMPKDVVVKSVAIRTVRTSDEESACVRKVNDAILALRRHGGGPVHINLEMGGCLTFGTKKLPFYTRIDRIEVNDLATASMIPPRAKIAIFAGSGRISPRWAEFAACYGAVVFADTGSSYHGPGHVNASLLCSQEGFARNPKYEELRPDLIIDIGEISGDYPVYWYCRGLAPTWRVSPDGEVRSRLGTLECVFEMPEEVFIEHYLRNVGDVADDFGSKWKTADLELRKGLPKLPFSNPWIAARLSPQIPENSVLHLGILNSLRSWNLFPPMRTVSTASNVGGFGIDGAVSTLIGASLANEDRLCFGVVGDLAFFYDMNALGNRYLRRNVRIVLVNNGCGAEFNMYFHPGSQFGKQTNDYIAAGRHFGNQSRDLVRHLAEDLGFVYLSAENKEELDQVLPDFCSLEGPRPMLLECFTDPATESEAHRLLNSIDPFLVEGEERWTDTVKAMVPRRVKNVIKAALNK